jgi:selenocysteine lyase/cysteine desulfurase
MGNDLDNMPQVHALLDPLRDGYVLSAEQCDELCQKVDAFLIAVWGKDLCGEDYWQHFQGLFDFKQPGITGVTPMNAANLCPEPRALLEVANFLRLEYNKNVAQQTRMARGARVRQLEAARSALANALSLRNEGDLAIIRNASEGNNAISCGYRGWCRTTNPAEREDVVLWAENHPTNLEAWRLRAGWELNVPLFEIKVVEFASTLSDDLIAKAFIEKIGPRTRFVSFSETANSTGFRMPEAVIKKIWDHVQKEEGRNCHVHIDGTMAWGARPINLSNFGCHSFVSSAHKWFLGPKETGILYMSPDKVRNFAPSIFAYDYKIEIGKWHDLPKNALRFELLGQRDDVNIITLAFTQMMWNVLALANRNPYQRVSHLAQYLKELLEKHSWTLITPTDPDRSWGVVRVEALQGSRAESLYHWLYDKRRIAGSGDSKTFRLCPHIYNTLADIQSAVDGMNEWRKLK